MHKLLRGVPVLIASGLWSAIVLGQATAGSSAGAGSGSASAGGAAAPGSGSGSGAGAGAGMGAAGGAGAGVGPSAAGAAAAAGAAPVVTYAPTFGLPPPGFDPNASLPSSSQPTLDVNQSTSHFDEESSTGSATVHGNKDAGGVFAEDRERGIEGAANVPGVYEVKRGDTLWTICDRFFHNAWDWPRVWALNPALQNPHWIYPGEQLRLSGGPSGPAQRNVPAAPVVWGAHKIIGSFVPRRAAVPPTTVFLRDQGYLDDVHQEWGVVSGSPDDQLFLDDHNLVYLEMAPGHDPAQGQELTIYRPLGSPRFGDGQGTLVAILGTAKVNGWDPKGRIARADVTESLDIIERGAKVGPIERRFLVVAPVKNAVDVRAHIAASLYPHIIFGQNQVLFIDRGAKDGLMIGNRLFAVDKGDRYRRTLMGASSFAAADVRYETEKPAAIISGGSLGTERDDAYPEEIVGEVRVLSTRDHSAACLVTSSKHELDGGQTVVAKAGY